MQLEFRYRFEAAHRFLKSESVPCMTPHGHTWYATLGLKFTGARLNDSQMAVEFSQLKKAWKTLIEETFDHSYMHNINDPIVEVLNKGENQARLVPFPGDPTTEVIALFMFHKMKSIMANTDFADKVQVQTIRLEETPTNSIICDQEFYLSEYPNFTQYSGWWQSTDPSDRSFRVGDK